MGQGRLTTHVLNTASGRPAADLKIELFRVTDGGAQSIAEVRTNADGRADAPLLEGEDFVPGVYELLFHAGDYLKANGQAGDDPLFLDLIPIRFGIANADQHFHVPLLLSPYGYSTYRGS